MSKVLLINSNRFQHPWPVMPFGLCCIATVLEHNGEHLVRFLDLCFSKNCEEDIRKEIYDFVPDVIGISVRNIDDTGGYNIHFLLGDVKKDVTDHCKKHFKGPIVIGGPSVGINGREMLEYFDLEYGIRGDGEAAMLEFVERIENSQELEGLKGLIIRRDNKIIQDNEPYRVEDLDSLPFPKPQRYLDIDRYNRYGSALQIQTKRGCALKCSYCTYNRIEGKRYRLRDPKLVAEEIEFLVKETAINHIEFVDSTFNMPLSHAKEVLKEIINKKLKLKIHTMGLSPAAIDEELLDLMKDAGFNEVDIGAESACNVILDDLAKDFQSKDIINAAKLLRKRKIPATWYIILGAPSETRETVIESLDTIARVASRWDMIFVSTGVRVYNGSPYSVQLTGHDNFFSPVKIEPGNICLEDIHIIAKRFSFKYPNFYLYEKEHIKPGWIIKIGTAVLNGFYSRQPIWRLLILLKRIEWMLGISFIKRIIFELRLLIYKIPTDKYKGFKLIKLNIKSL